MNERPMAEMPIRDFLATLASKTPAPGGGAAAAMAGATAAALAEMVVSFSLGKKNLAEHQPLLASAAQRLANARAIMLELADEDAAAYGAVNELSKLPEGDARRLMSLPGAVRAAVDVPRAIMACASDMLRLMEELVGRSNRYLASDLAIAAVLAASAARGGAWNVEVNASQLPDAESKAGATSESRRVAQDAEDRARRIEAAVMKQLPG
jgi:formiminotetrahydrofolate cyclodeaminase